MRHSGFDWLLWVVQYYEVVALYYGFSRKSVLPALSLTLRALAEDIGFVFLLYCDKPGIKLFSYKKMAG